MRKAKLFLLLFFLLPILANAQRSNKDLLGWNHSFNAYYQGGLTNTDEIVFGAALRYGLQYNFGKTGQAGLLTGIENFNIELGELIFPVLATYTLEFTEPRSKPFVCLGVGYGFAAMYTNRPVLETRGGLGADVQIGYSISIKNKTAFTTGIGYRYQEASYTSRAIFENNDVVKRDYRFNRFYWNIGLKF